MILDLTTQPLLWCQPTKAWRNSWKLEWDARESMDAPNLLDQINFARRVKPTPERHRAIPPVGVEGGLKTKAQQDALDLVARDGRAQQLGRARLAQTHRLGFWQQCNDILWLTQHRGARPFDDQLRGADGGNRCEVRANALLPAIRSVCAQSEGLRCALNATTIEAGSLKHYLCRGVGDL